MSRPDWFTFPKGRFLDYNTHSSFAFLFFASPPPQFSAKVNTTQWLTYEKCSKNHKDLSETQLVDTIRNNIDTGQVFSKENENES